MKDFFKNPFSILLIVILVIIVLGVGSVFLNKSNNSADQIGSTIPAQTVSSNDQEVVTDAEIRDEINDVLEILSIFHYISLTDKELTDPNAVILDELQESMNDLNKLQGILGRTETLSKSKNEVISTTGLVLNVSASQLIESYNKWINYLRGVNPIDPDVAEFQYQLALFQSSTHDVYLKLVEGASLLPYVAVEFAKNDSEDNKVNDELKSYFLSRIDVIFKDILIDNDLFYQKTKNRYAVAILVRGYIDFFKTTN